MLGHGGSSNEAVIKSLFATLAQIPAPASLGSSTAAPSTAAAPASSSSPSPSTFISGRSGPPNPLPAAAASSPSLKPLLLTLHVLYPSEVLPALDLLDRGLVTRLSTAAAPPDPPTPLPGSSFYVVRSSARTQPRTRQREGAGGGLAGSNTTATATPTATATAGRDWGQGAAGLAGQADGGAREWGALPRPARVPSYEVRLGAWNCTCPAFTFAAFAGPEGWGEEEDEEVVEGEEEGDGEDEGEEDGAEGGIGTEGGRLSAAGGAQAAGVEWNYGGLRRRDRRAASSRTQAEAPMCKHLLACLLIERCPLFAACVESRLVSGEEAAGWTAGWDD